MGERPTGVVTFLMTDIEGSTARWEADADGMRRELTRHDAVLSAAIDGAGGWMFKHTGDGVLAAFERPDAALEAAVAAQRALELPVRMGISTGPAEHRNDDYYGPALNHAARVMSSGHGGQILVAESTAALLAHADLLDLGAHHLRGLSRPMRVFQACAPGLDRSFPALSASTVGMLPMAPDRLVGREGELSDLEVVLDHHRVVTLTGVGGVGKTRLAVALADRVRHRYPDGVWFTELASVEGNAAIAQLVASMFGTSPGSERAVRDALLDSLASKQSLIALDNCEHLIDGVAELVDEIIGRCPGISILATSREALMVEGEQIWPVPSLEIDDASSAGVELFLERARSVAPNWDPAGDLEDVIEICRQLEGIPLAIELAAARVRSLGPVEIRERLDDRFRLLSGGRRRSLERHQTLRHAVRWSFDLLSPDEQQVLMCLSTFATGFGLRAAERVCADGTVAERDVVDHLDSLVRKSLLAPDRTHSEIRFRQLETIRQFAEEELVQSGRADDVRARHARFFATSAEEMFDVWRSPKQSLASEWCAREMDNLRIAFSWSADGPDPDPAIRLAATIGDVARFQLLHEAYTWADGILETARARRSAYLPVILTWAASNAWGLGCYDEAEQFGLEAVALSDEPGFESFVWAFTDLAIVALHRGDVERAVEFARRGAEHPADERDRFCLAFLPWLLTMVGRNLEALSVLDASMDVIEDTGIPMSIAMADMGLGHALASTDPDRALDAFERALDLACDAGITMFESSALAAIAELHSDHGDIQVALRRLDLMLTRSIGSVDEGTLNTNLKSLANVLVSAGAPEPAAVIAGWLVPRSAPDALAPLMSQLRSALDDGRVDACLASGEALTRVELVSMAADQVRRRLD